MLYGSGQLLNPATNRVGSYQVNTSGSPIVLNLNNRVGAIFIGSVPIGAIATWTMTNTANSKLITVLFEMSALAAQTFPSNWIVATNVGVWNGVTWTPDDLGTYEINGTYDSINDQWQIRINGPYT